LLAVSGMEPRFRNYSSDSMSSDGVFIEELFYQGMLRSMDHRKGRVSSVFVLFQQLLSLKSFMLQSYPVTLSWSHLHEAVSYGLLWSAAFFLATQPHPFYVSNERDRVQKKTFTKWVNKHLMKAQRHITDLYEDLRDGHNLISLLEVLSGETLPREKGRMRFHKLQNVQIALDFLKHRQVKLVNIRNDDIADGNPKLTLGLIWTIILHFQISDIQVNGQSDDMTAKEKLLLWSQRMVEGYQGLRCDNFTTSWRDGRIFNAIIHKHR
ncbi:hypothetical protein GOODEAATRI_011604, partial [Goodea atripinnis]